MEYTTAEMPYFIKPSLNFSDKEKVEAYDTALSFIDALLEGEKDTILKMSSINSILKSHLPYYYWVGFYMVNNGRLSVGPYQGTLGCLHIEFGKGVCGAVAQSKETKIVDDVHILSQGTEHIACDSNSKSEIVVPVFDTNKDLIAVFDVDSTLTHSFNEVDQSYLETIMKRSFEQ